MFKDLVYQNRRNKLKSRIESGLVILMGAKEIPINSPDNPYFFRQDSSFLYYTGLDTPHLALTIDLDTGEERLYGNDMTKADEIWCGLSPAVKDLAIKSAIEKSAPYGKLAEILKEALKKKRPVHYLPPYQGEIILELCELLGKNREEIASSASRELTIETIKLRSVKDENEIKEMEAAVNIAHKMHTTAMIMAMPGAFEQELKGVIEGIAVSAGGMISFQPILSIRGDILHNPRYSHTLEKGKMLVVDAGAETAKHYTSDITRSVPIGKSFTRLQKNIYEIVLKANQTAIENIRPGLTYKSIHLESALIIAEGLKELGIMKGDCKSAVEEGAHALFFPHGLGHMIGLDVHDMYSLGEDEVGYDEEVKRSDQFGLSALRLGKKLESGFTITVEPGIYFIETLIDQWKTEKRFSDFINYEQVELYKGMGGIRIEDDVLVTETGSRILGKPIPKTIKEIESY